MFPNIYIYIYSIQNFKKKKRLACSSMDIAIPSNIHWAWEKYWDIAIQDVIHLTHLEREKSKFNRPLLVDTKRTKKTACKIEIMYNIV